MVSLRGPEARMSAERIRMIAPLVVETADVISRDFFDPPVRRSTV